ncbi:MAG: ABC transporter ATP-binding protein [Kofleriaceae bacterium]|nr:ABC transporter ATP-binding protein [Myxococcales bacterium]MCB9565271.1 ABC transporter ATP-binding protein [Kofleriaceae bacterium]
MSVPSSPTPPAGALTPWTYVLRYRGRIYVGGVMLLLTNLLFLGVPVTMGMAVQAIGGPDPAGEVPRLALLMSAFAIGTAVTRIVSRVMIFNAARAAEYDLRGDLFAHLLTLDPGYYRAHPTGDVMSRLTSDVQTVRALWGAGILNLVNTGFAFVTVMVMMLRVDPVLTFWAILPFPTIFVIGQFMGRRIYRASRAVQQNLGALSNAIQEDLTGIQVIKAYGVEDARRIGFVEHSEKVLASNMDLTRVRGQLGPALAAVGSLAAVIVLFVGGRRVLSHDIELGNLIEFNGYLARLAWPTLALGWMLSLLERGRASWTRLESLLRTRPAVADGAGAALDPEEVAGDVRVEGLTLELEGRRILDDVSLHMTPGTITAIVGRTGSGKSTLVDALARVIDVPPGTIFLDGRDVTTLPLASLRGAIGYAPQEAFLFSTSIADNIAFGFGAGSTLPKARADELDRAGIARRAEAERAPVLIDGEPVPRIADAAGAAGLVRDLEQMPQRYRTIVGERGITLSGGQRQRVALARALASRPRVLVLDDSLSSVDAETERIILDRLREIMQGRTSILISHRVAAVKNADQIVVLDDGRVVERGTHDELLAAGGVYAELYRTQLADGVAVAEVAS